MRCHYLCSQWVAHLHTVLRALHARLRVGGRCAVVRFTTRTGVGWRADDDSLVDLHDGPLDGVGERAAGGGPHVHDHTALRSRHLQHQTADEC